VKNSFPDYHSKRILVLSCWWW